MNQLNQIKHRLSAVKHICGLQDALVQERIAHYLLLIAKWNRHYNLTAIKTIEDMLYQHIVDSLVVVEYLNGPQVVDVGTGAGLPGIPIAIVRPDWQVTLIESNQKKTAFLQQVKIELSLDNITIVAKRIEDTMIKEKISTIISRAYASMGDFIRTTQHLIASDDEQCRWFAMKGRCTQQELDEVIKPYFVETKIPLIIPELSAQRELIIIRRLNTAENAEIKQEYLA